MTSGPLVSGQALRCPKCSLSLETALFGGGTWVECPACRSQLKAAVFPALENPLNIVTTSSGERAVEGEAACFFHPDKMAAAACDRCGRFLCALCDVPFGGKHLCPSCLDSSKMSELLGSRLVWGHLAMLVGVGPFVLLPACFVFWFMGFLTGPAAIFIALWGWNKPPSLVHGKRRGMAVMGLIGGALQLAVLIGTIWGFAYMVRKHG